MHFKWILHKKVILDEAIMQITQLSQETPDYELNKNYLLSRIQDSLAVLYSIKKEYSKTLFYYNKIDVTILDSYFMFDPKTFKLKVIFNKVKMNMIWIFIMMQSRSSKQQKVSLNRFKMKYDVCMEFLLLSRTMLRVAWIFRRRD